MYNLLSIGIDQSYTKTGISIAADGKLLKVSSVTFKGCKDKTQKRNKLRLIIENILLKNSDKASEVIILCERIRTFSHNNKASKEESEPQNAFMNIGYIKATGALVATIVDAAYDFKVPVYSVDTRSWKAQVVGTTKGKKQPALDFVKAKGFDMGKDDDAADSACISLYAFIPKGKQTLKKEE